MSRTVFETGERYQKATATWVQKRLCDRQGRCFLAEEQSGVLLADGVGMGKTWEALAATALILNGLKLQKRKGRVLVVCPPNLVTKWEDELSTGSPFRKLLNRWARHCGTQTATQIEKTLAAVVPVRRSRHVQTRKKYGKFMVESGTYIVSHGLLQRKGVGLSAMRRQNWDVIIVDEAHHASARKALMEMDHTCRHKLLLSATPFQLHPGEWNRLTRRIVSGRKTLLGCGEVKEYLDAVDERFKNVEAPGPSARQVRAAAGVVRLIVARTIAAKSPRVYSLLLPDGSPKRLQCRLDELDDKTVRQLFATLGEHSGLSCDFESEYLKCRYDLATREDRTFVATKLRRFLAKGVPSAKSPRLSMLRNWAKLTWIEDLTTAIQDGLPRKSIVFTSWVGQDADSEAEMLKELLTEVFNEALRAVRSRRPTKWKYWRSRGKDSILGLESKIKMPYIPNYAPWKKHWEQLPIVLRHLANDELTAVMAGAQRRFLLRLKLQIQRQLDAIGSAWVDYDQVASKISIEGRGARRRFNDAIGAYERWGDKRELGYVERYTGNEDRITRDRAAAGFREVTQPWVLVASNVGAEGIDLQTYTRRIVHYDLEWNPARMEQREGRGDRVGRELHEKLDILYCLVPRTYDERMFHQLVARDRWHGVLLGKAGAKLVEDEATQHTRLEASKFIKRVRLNLSPLKRERRNGSRVNVSKR